MTSARIYIYSLEPNIQKIEKVKDELYAQSKSRDGPKTSNLRLVTQDYSPLSTEGYWLAFS
jgi:hypothetical protein